MNLDKLHKDFIKEKRFLDNISPTTIRSYELAFRWFKKLAGNFDKPSLNNFVIGLREAGLCPSGCNVKIRSINSFLTWLHENGHTPEHIKIKQLKTEQVIIKTFSDDHIKAFLKFKPKGNYEWRLHTIICFLIDTGARIDEALGVKSSGVDLEQLLVNIRGKGNKERIVPISIEMRKILHIYITRHRLKGYSDYLFPTSTGTRMMYRNFFRDMKAHGDNLGIKGARISPHGFRHYFAQNFLRRGGDLYRLQRILGHTNIATTQLYLKSMGISVIQEIHQQLSPLSQLR